MSDLPLIQKLDERIPFEGIFSVPKPSTICWGVKIHMPPDGGAGGPTFFANLDAVYDQIAVVSKPGN
jgi:hypothetical protein